MGWGEHIISYTRKIQENPNDTTAYFNRGETYLNLKQYEAAIRDFSKIIDEITPNFSGYYNEQAYYKRGLAYSCLKKCEKATQDFEKCTIWYHGRGQDYYELEQYELAIQDFSKAIELDSSSSEAYFNRSVAYSGLEKYERAISDVSRYIELNPDDAKGYYLRGKYSQDLSRNDFERAKSLGYEE